MELSIQIKKYRTELHLSQEELAEKVYVTRQTISNWENEKSYPDIHSLLLLSSLFNVSLDQLIKGDIEKMKEIISEQEIKKFNYYGSIYTVHLAVLIISAVVKGLFSMIDDVQITNSHIMVAGSMAVEDEGTKIVVYDYDGNQLLKLGGEDISSPDKLGSITGMAETENGFVAADGNMREIQFWAKDGTHVGAISTEDIFGVSYPWLEDMQLLDDGSLLIMLTQERDDGSANELMFFRLTGF